MFGMIITTGIGTLAFKLGMEAQRMKAEGKRVPEIIARMPTEASSTVVGATKWCYEAVCGKKRGKNRGA
jgi:hypothetical protein